MRRAALSVLVSFMLACSGRADNPAPAPGSGGAGGAAGGGGGGGASGSGSGAGGRAGTAGSAAGGSSGGSAGSTGGAPEAGAPGAGEGGQDQGTGGAEVGGAADAGAGGAPSGYCGLLTGPLTTGSGTPSDPATPLSDVAVAGSTCGAVERTFTPDPALHVDPCLEVAYRTNPPSSGTHYSFWAAYKTYSEPIPRGFWVHSLEHGAVVLAYSCTDCDDEVARAEALIASAGSDPACTLGETRLILTPDPRLDTRWAAASWGVTLVADCFEEAAFGDFIDAHRGHGPEAVCSDGVDVGL